ncbi:MAG: hypothetical protein JXJ04_00255 [Spirochaetales bacterium]|nr:hypothetical protein [Spirochaetales bacterium]
MLVRFIIGFILSVAAITGILLSWDVSILVYVHLPSFILVVLFSLFALFTAFPLSEIKTAFVHAFSKKEEGEADYKRDIVVFSALQQLIFCAGGVGVFLGLIFMLAKIEDKSAIGMGLSTTLVSFLYSLYLNLVLVIPCKAVLTKKMS